MRAFNRMIGRNLQAWCLFDAGDEDAAEALLRKNLTGDPRLDNATLHMIGLVQAAGGNDDAALETFERIWSTGARLAAGAETYAELLAARGEREKASAVLDQFRDQVGQNAALKALKVRIDKGEAITPHRLTARQGAALSMFLPASALMFQTDDDVASVYFVLALALDPQLQQARTMLGQSLLQGERPEAAIRVLSEVPASSPYYAAARGQMANTLLRQEKPEEALAIASAALALKPERSLQVQVADIYRALERHAEAEALLTDVITADTAAGRDDWRVYFARGASRERQSDWDTAESDLEHALALQPDNAAVLNYLGYSWIDRGIRLDEGVGLISRAVVLEPNSGHIIDSLGWAHFKMGDYEEAVDVLERAIELLPADPTLNDHLGDAYWKAGRRKEAGFQWKRALKTDLEPEDRARIEQKLLTGLGTVKAITGADAAR